MNCNSLLMNGIKVSDLITVAGDIHHIFPRAYLKKNGIDSKTKYNQVANYIYLDTQVNKAISDDAPCDYFSKAFMQCETKAIELGNICNLSQLNENLQENCIPLSVKNMDASSYEEFLTERRKLMASMSSFVIKSQRSLKQTGKSVSVKHFLTRTTYIFWTKS